MERARLFAEQLVVLHHPILLGVTKRSCSDLPSSSCWASRKTLTVSDRNNTTASHRDITAAADRTLSHRAVVSSCCGLDGRTD